MQLLLHLLRFRRIFAPAWCMVPCSVLPFSVFLCLLPHTVVFWGIFTFFAGMLFRCFDASHAPRARDHHLLVAFRFVFYVEQRCVCFRRRRRPHAPMYEQYIVAVSRNININTLILM